ncbi:MAG: S41 family peptidase [Planctomycetota bacterium]
MALPTLPIGAALLAALSFPAPPQAPSKSPSQAPPDGVLGYYREPALHGDTIVFCAEGDLWTVSAGGGLARRLTSHHGVEQAPAISPDGTEVLFSATYDGPIEVYAMPLRGGVPQRITWENESSIAVGWTPDGDPLYATLRYSTLPDPMLVRYDRETRVHEPLPLAQASDGAFDAAGETLVFARPGFHRNNTRRYVGGTARNLWRFSEGDAEATNLTADFPGEDHSPIVRGDRVVWVNDRSGMMNLWSMSLDGGDLRQHTDHEAWDVKDPELDASGATGRVVYQLGADLWIHDLDGGEERRVDVALQSDLDQLAETWESDPLDYLTYAAIDAAGERIALTSRGRVFVFPVKHGRRLQIDRRPGTRYRDATFLDAERILLLSDESGEVEFETRPADGIGDGTALTTDGSTLRFAGLPSPDGKRIAFEDKNDDLKILDVATGEETLVSTSRDGIGDFAWSPDGAWLCFVQAAPNSFSRLWLHEVATGDRQAVTSDRTNSRTPAFSPDGTWLYFLSDRNLRSAVGSPWGPRQPEPYFDRTMEVYQVALQSGLRPTFWPEDELTRAAKEREESGQKEGQKDEAAQDGAEEGGSDADVAKALPAIELEGIADRVWRVPVAAGNYSRLRATKAALFMLSRGADETDLVALKIEADAKPVVVVPGVRTFELAGERKKLLVRKGGFHVVPAKASKANLDDTRIDLSGWAFPIDLREDYRQLFVDAWRLERDYFYDPGMHGLDWEGVRDKYLPLVDRVTTREELNHLIGEVVAELSALHVSVRGGDVRRGEDNVRMGALGARLRRDAEAGGYVVEHVYRADPDLPAARSPLGDPYHAIRPGATLLAIDGHATLEADDIGELLRGKAGRPVRVRLRDGDGSEPRDVLVEPTSNELDLRYSDWELSRRLAVDEATEGRVGYVHLRAMGSSNITEWYRNFYPVFDRAGLIVDVRHNRGGNIDSILLEKLMRRAWFYWQGRTGRPTWNMQYAFRGHMVVLVDERTASDGEAFAEGFRRLGLGPVIGTRTWGGEIWLSSNNRLSDRGLARAPQTGVYGPEREWLIEGWGVVPDIVVDNLPHETFQGRDAQLEKAIEVLLERIAEDPREVPPPPPHPDKSWSPR